MQHTHFRTIISAVLVCALSLAAQKLDVFHDLDRILSNTRMALAPKSASDDIVFVAIDAASLDAVGSWPWSRSVHANILDNLTNAGAEDVFFDIDFDFPSDADGDRAFMAALDRAGGTTYLAAFMQPSSMSNADVRHYNFPLAAFAERSWPALVNVMTDERGLVRNYPLGDVIEGQFIPSAGSLIAGHFVEATHTVEIDFSIRPQSFRIVSAIDVIERRVPDSVFEGRAIIIGASAIELGDQYAVPVHGVIPGPLIHALAAETLRYGLNPRWLKAEVLTVLLFVLLCALHFRLKRSPTAFVIAIIAAFLVVEACAFSLFRQGSLMVPSAMLYPSLIAFGLWRLATSLTNSRWDVRKTSAKFTNTRRLLEQVFDDSTDAFAIIDGGGQIIRHSRSAEQLFGVDSDGRLKLPERLHQHVLAQLHADGLIAGPLIHSMSINLNGKIREIEYSIARSHFDVPTSQNKDANVEIIATLTVRDVTETKQQERQIAYLSNHDELTGALRRSAFLAFLKLRLEAGEPVAVFALNLQRFRTINVVLGRNIGDAVLKEMTDRLNSLGEWFSATTRLDADNFAVFTEKPIDTDVIDKLTAIIVKCIHAPYRVAGTRGQLNVRIGHTIVTVDDDTTAELALDHAVEALETAKSTFATTSTYDPAISKKQSRFRAIEGAMADALANREFHVLYQPQYGMADGRLTGAESLVRWKSPSFGPVFPDEFIPIAESTGFIVELGRWVLQEAAKDALRMPQDTSMAVNVSGVQLMHAEVISDVLATLKTTGLPPQRLCLEITESVLLSSIDPIIEIMQDLRFSGVKWALDDFGTGYSSMAYLSRMPLDKIKLDKAFIMDLDRDPKSRIILHTVGELCRGLGATFLCEGVETSEHVRILRSENCAEMQGYFFGKPMPIDDLLKLPTFVSPLRAIGQ